MALPASAYTRFFLITSSMKKIVNNVFRWCWLLFKWSLAIIVLLFAFSLIVVNYSTPDMPYYSTEPHVGDIDGFWFESSRAKSPTLRYGGGVKAIFIKKLQNNNYNVEYIIDDNTVSDGEFTNAGGVLTAHLNTGFGGRKYIFLKNDQLLVYEGIAYKKIGKKFKRFEFRNRNYLKVEPIKTPDTSAKHRLK